MDDAAGPSKSPVNKNTVGKGKENMVPEFKLTSDLEQFIDLQKVFKERILDSRVDISFPGDSRTHKEGVLRSSHGSRKEEVTIDRGAECSESELEL